MPIVQELEGDVSASPRQTLVCTINTTGAMGAGVALSLRESIPGLYEFYRKLHKAKALTVDKMYLYPFGEGRQVLLFPTKQWWGNPSRYDWIEANLIWLRDKHEQMGISDMAMVPLGCGNGHLNYEDMIRPLMYHYLDPLPFETDIIIGTKKKK